MIFCGISKTEKFKRRATRADILFYRASPHLRNIISTFVPKRERQTRYHIGRSRILEDPLLMIPGLMLVVE